MRFQSDLDGAKLRPKLMSMMEQERSFGGGRNQYYKAGCKRNEDLVEIRQRDEVVRWLLVVHHKLGYSPDTFDLSVAILDRFLLLVRAHSRYLKCIAISSYFLAAKCMEEDEIILATCDLVAISSCGCKVTDVLRMERVILSKLKWDLQSKTVLDFVHMMYGLLMSKQVNLIHPRDAGFQVNSLIYKLYICLCSYEIRAFTPSTLALALVSIELSCHVKNWLAIVTMLQKEISLSHFELIQCRELVSRILSRNYYANQSRARSYGWKVATKPGKRKVEQTEVDDDVYEGIKRLYGDENAAHDSVLSCTQTVLSSVNVLATPVSAVAAS